MSYIFLVEDDPYISRVYERAFRVAGHELEIQMDGESAWKALSTTQRLPSVILLDLTLPKMSGEELLAHINQDHRFDSTPVAVLTNAYDKDIEKRIMSEGADLYLLKIDHQPSELVAKVEALIGKAS